MYERKRMDLDAVVDNELLTRQADALVGNEAVGERTRRIAHIHHDLNFFRQFKVLEIRLFDGKLQLSSIHEPRCAFGATHRNFLAALDRVRSGAGADDAGYAELPRNDGRMT